MKAISIITLIALLTRAQCQLQPITRQLAAQHFASFAEAPDRLDLQSKNEDDEYIFERDNEATYEAARNPELLNGENVTQHAGYIDLPNEDKHFFFWLYESRNDPKKDPLVLWLNGGPGCSSMLGSYAGVGPTLIKSASLQPERNPYSWTTNANILFLDQPVNTGFSYSSRTVGTTREAAKDMYKFMEIFYQKFPQYRGLDFHVAGESYGGHYVPALGSEILSHPDRTFNLTSILIGNGLIDEMRQIQSYGPMACGEGGVPPVLSQSQCQQLRQDLNTCSQSLELCDRTNSQNCPNMDLCLDLSSASLAGGKSIYDLRVNCSPTSCDDSTQEYIAGFMNSPKVMQTLGVRNIEFLGCSQRVFVDFLKTGDHQQRFSADVRGLLERDVGVLVFAGDKDYICNWIGNKAWTDQLEWKSGEQYRSQKEHEWISINRKGGTAKNFGPLTYVRLYDVGHQVAMTTPENAFTLFNRWIKGDRALIEEPKK